MSEHEGEPRPARFAEQLTPNGHRCDEAASALQKTIRRGLEAEALYWASELDLAGYPGYVWKRLRIIASEDVGLGEPGAAATVRALYENWLELRKAKDRSASERLFLVHAVVLLARARKSRMVDHALIATYQGERPALEVPDWALDRHTARGRAQGRGYRHFLDEGAALTNEAAVSDPYREAAAEALAAGDGGDPEQGRFPSLG